MTNLTDKQLSRMLKKLKRFESTLEQLIFEKIDNADMRMLHTNEAFNNIPDASLFSLCTTGDVWQGEGTYCWFMGEYRVPAAYDGKPLYIYPKIGGYEGFLWVNGKPRGIFCSKINVHSRGNHYCCLLKETPAGDEVINIALEYYANHYIIGTSPFETETKSDFRYTYTGVDICVKNIVISDFYFDLRVLNQMAESLDENSFRRADILRVLKKVHACVYYDYDNVDKETFISALQAAGALMKPLFNKKNSETAPYVGLIGHSHMDTAWLWHRGETLKKCARTYANQISLMSQYPEYKFIQSSAHHGAMIKEHYPDLFVDIQKLVVQGRYEPNGGAWIECDCNIPSGEYIIRQFIWGQRFTRENFDYTSDCFWLPDTFGYSASLPQILKGCRINYFLTTKIAANDTNEFPYDAFYWQGIDGSKVFVHFNKMHLWPEPQTMLRSVSYKGHDSLREKVVSDMRLFSYGFGDGGGGPQFEMIETARRIGDMEGLPRSEHTTVSRFMEKLESNATEPSVYCGEIYFELHRGTLTNQHTIKRNNRLAEIAIHNLEYASVRRALSDNTAPSVEHIRPLVEGLLINQFHDILPGTCITRAHEESIAETTQIIKCAADCLSEYINIQPKDNKISLMNTLSFDRNDVLYLPFREGFVIDGCYNGQPVTDLNGDKYLAVSGVGIPAFSTVELTYIKGTQSGASAFTVGEHELETPFYKVVFDERSYIASLVDKRVKRELRGKGYPLNTFLTAEDVPLEWDNWDIDADCFCKFRDNAELLESEIVSNGSVELRIRSKYRLTPKSTLKQDIIFYADNPEIRFDTIIDWQDDHRFLKTAFDTTIHSDTAIHEIQFGYIKRATHRNTSIEKAKFEVSNHKYTDLSETRYGVALLNDCKYGISVEGSSMWLSLHKGGCRPDEKGDKGIHACSYAFYPHTGGFGAKSVIQPAYCFNCKPVFLDGACGEAGLMSVDAENIIVETVKPAEKTEKAFVIRLYEAEGTYTRAVMRLNLPVTKLELTNMLEETLENIEISEYIAMEFKPFEIKTYKIYY